MGGGPIIIIDPNRVKSPLSNEETAAKLREVADMLDSGEMDAEPVEDTE